jgi:hypothetical protein
LLILDAFIDKPVMKTLFQLVPKLPPAIDGLGDYALNLARQLRTDFGIQTHFLIGDPQWVGASEIEGFPITQIQVRSAVELTRCLQAQKAHTLILHYVGYGFAQRGCPTWLVDGLQDWLQHMAGAQLATMFHEVAATGPIWSSAYWLSTLQKKLAGRLARLSHCLLTSHQQFADSLQQLTSGQQAITLLPVPSNIGEPDTFPALTERQRNLVIFGHPNSRMQVYQQYSVSLQAICQSLQIEQILDIGVPLPIPPSQLSNSPVQALGILSAEALSTHLLQSVAGFLAVPPPALLAKSGVFGAYCAHGLVSILPTSSRKLLDGLVAGQHYWDGDRLEDSLTLSRAAAIARDAHAWYRRHALPAHAQFYASNLFPALTSRGVA